MLRDCIEVITHPCLRLAVRQMSRCREFRHVGATVLGGATGVSEVGKRLAHLPDSEYLVVVLDVYRGRAV